MGSEAAQRKKILEDNFVQPLNWALFGPVERFFGRILTPREKVIAESFLLSQPRWSWLYCRILIWFLLYLAANSLMRFQSLDELAMFVATKHLERFAVLAPYPATLILVGLILKDTMSMLLWWSILPATGSAARTTTRAPWRTYQLFPFNYWEAAKVIAKINGLTCVLLMLPAVFLSFTPACAMIMRSTGGQHAFPPKCVVLAWGCTLLLVSFNLTPSILDGLKYWRSWSAKLLLLIACYLLGFGLLGSPTLALDLLLGGIFMSVTAGWFLYAGAQYRKGVFYPR